MKKLFFYALAITAIVNTGCRKIEVDGTGSGGGVVVTPGTENTILEGRITSSRTLKAEFTYKLRGLVYVTNGAILTIEPGTKIVGENGRNGGLVITRSSRINAEGTAAKPIVFTSEASTPARGDWAGVVLLGNAPTNRSFNGIQGIGEVEGGINNSDGLGLYGTPASQAQNPADNSGILKYVRIEYAGFAFLPDQEINSLTMAGVGTGTVIDYVQVSYANDDAFEWFGGTVNCSHLIATRTLDDDFDTDNGYSGKVQFGISQRDSAVADVSRTEAFESDNDSPGSSLTPQTSAIFSNMTVMGPRASLTNVGNSNYLAGAQIRRNSSMSLVNSIILGYPTGLFLDATRGIPTDNNTTSTLLVRNTIIGGCATPLSFSRGTNTTVPANPAFDVNLWFNTAAYGNAIYNTNAEVGLIAAFNYNNPDFNPTSGSVAISGASFANARLATGFSTVAYRGACNVGDTWWKTWTKF